MKRSFVYLRIILFIVLLQITIASGDIFIENADTIWNNNIVSVSDDVTDSSDTLPQNLSSIFITNADTIWNNSPVSMPDDVINSNDALPQNLSSIFITNADTIWNNDITMPEEGVTPAPTVIPTPTITTTPPSEIAVGQGVSDVNIRNAFIDAYNRDVNGGESKLGKPITEVYTWEGYLVQEFPGVPNIPGGIIMYNSDSSVQKAFYIQGAIYQKYKYYPNKERLGPVKSDEMDAAISPQGTTGRYSEFMTGRIHWISDKNEDNKDHPQRGGSFITYDGLDTKYTELHGTFHWLGFPIMDQIEQDGHNYCEFEGGLIEWDGTQYKPVKTYEVNGHVSDKLSQPIEGVKITIYKDIIEKITENNNRYSNGVKVEDIFTNVNGDYNIKLRFNTYPYQIIASKDGYIYHGYNSHNSITTVNFTLPKWSEVEKKTYSVVLAKFKDIQPQHDRQFFENILFPQINDYYFENSNGKIQFDFKIYDNNGQWYTVNNDMAFYGNKDCWPCWEYMEEPVKILGGSNEFMNDAWNMAKNENGIDQADAFIYIYPTSSFQQYETYTDNSDENSWNDGHPGKDHLTTHVYPYPHITKKDMVISENEFVGPWSHEIGHLLGAKDLYGYNIAGGVLGIVSGNIIGQDLMGEGDSEGSPIGFKPVHMSAFTKIDQGFLTESAFLGEHDIPILSKMKLKDSIFFIKDEFGDDKILIEGRNKDPIFSKWDVSIQNGVKLYKQEVDPIRGTIGLYYLKTLEHNGEEYVTALGLYGYYKVNLVDDQVSKNDINYRVNVQKESIFSMKGVTLKYIDFGVIHPPTLRSYLDIYPDLDLHAYTSDGRHVGINYITNTYENQIQDSLSSGDILGGDEWILIPSNEDANFTVTNKESREFYEKYPEYLNITNGTENFSLTSYNFDVNGQVHTSSEDNFTMGLNDESLSYSYKSDITPPQITINVPVNENKYILNQDIIANWSVIYLESGIASKTGTKQSGEAIDTSTVGTKTFTVNATDNASNSATKTVSYNVIYNFAGFSQPIDNPPILNSVKAGSAIPVKFNLSGNQGLDIFASGYPGSQKISCDSNAPISDIEETVTAGSSNLSYNVSIDQYNYVWKIDKTWTGSCRNLTVKLKDGTYHNASFKFK